MIPKVFHYCWFGPKKIGELEKKCIESWSDVHPEFEIKKWDETNCNLDHPFIKEAYKHKKWAFVADFIRFEVLAKEGGVYMDTDMLLLKPIDSLLSNEGFIGFEDDKYVSAGIIGAKRENSLVTELRMLYQSLKFNLEEPVYINLFLNTVFKKNGLEELNIQQDVNGFAMYPSEVFYPYTFKDSKEGIDFKSSIKENSLAVHLWNHSWGDEFSEFAKGNTFQGIKKSMSKISKNPSLPKQYYKKLGRNILYSLGKKR